MRRYSILVREQPAFSDAREYELCQCDTNPKEIAQAALQKKMTFRDQVLKKRTTMPKFTSVRIRENATKHNETGGT